MSGWWLKADMRNRSIKTSLCLPKLIDFLSVWACRSLKCSFLMVIVLQDSFFASVMRRSLSGSQENIEVFKAAPGCAVLGLRLHNGRTLDFCRATTPNHVYQILLCGLGRQQKLDSQGYVWTLSISLRLSWHCGRASPNSGWVGIEACLNPEERWQRVMTAMRAPKSNWIEMSSGEGASVQDQLCFAKIAT